MASEIWTGPSLTFVKPSGTDGTLPANQDRLMPDVWLTRNLTMGLFNAAQETTYERYSSPIGTEWAYGTLANYSSLTYTNWEGWNGHNPPSMVGKDAVLHLISDDIYLSIKFTVWGGRGGAFSYERSTPIPEPSAALLTVLGLAMARYGAGCALLAAYLAGEAGPKLPLVFAAMRDKDVGGMFLALLPAVCALFVTQASNPRTTDLDVLAHHARMVAPNLSVTIEPSLDEALDAAWRISRRIVVAGSIFLVGDVIKRIGG